MWVADGYLTVFYGVITVWGLCLFFEMFLFW